MAGKTYVTEGPELSFNLSHREFIYINNSNAYAFELYFMNNKYSNTSTVLSFDIQEFDEAMPIYRIILDFMDATGGIY